MKRLIILAALALPLSALAQGTVNDLATDFQTRTSIAADWKIVKGLHLEAEYELRTRDNLSAISRHMGTVGLSYKFLPGLKAGVSYSYISHHGANKGWSDRHRVSGQIGYTHRFGDWSVGIRETLRWTHKTESLNTLQENPDPLTLKSRLKVEYKGFKRIDPYAFVEVRNVFNDPLVNATWSTTSKAYADYSFGGYGDAYFNRVRGGLGLDWKLSKNSSLGFYIFEDYCYDKDIDVSKDGTTLKSLTWNQQLNTIVGVGYTFSF